MPKKRISMRKLRDVLRLRLHAQLSMRHIRDSLRISLGTIQTIDKKAQELTLDWPAIEQLDDQALARCFYPIADVRKSTQFEVPSWTELHQELKGKGVTKHLLWEEYAQKYPNRCYSYSPFCDRYLHWFKKQRRSMRQIHKAGEKLFVDYAGETVPIVSGSGGEVRTAQIFVALMGATNYTFAEATYSQSLPNWLGSYARTFDFLGGVPQMVVPDNLKSGVTKGCRYDPDLNPAYQQLAAHFAREAL